MTIHIKRQGKFVEVGWNSGSEIEGPHASVEVEREGADVEVKDVPNVTGEGGSADLFFPSDFTGSVRVTVKGSKDGSDTNTISVN